MGWNVYIVRCADGTLYTGATNDMERRVRMHNAARGAKYTRTRLPVVLVWSQTCTSQGDALRLEASIKNMSRVQKDRLIAETNAAPVRVLSSNGESRGGGGALR